MALYHVLLITFIQLGLTKAWANPSLDIPSSEIHDQVNENWPGGCQENCAHHPAHADVCKKKFKTYHPIFVQILTVKSLTLSPFFPKAMKRANLSANAICFLNLDCKLRRKRKLGRFEVMTKSL